MGAHPLNLALRFMLEIIALVALGLWGWDYGSERYQYFLAGGLPVTFSLIWGIFNVPNDPSRSGKAPVIVPGYLRLLIELCLFGLAVWALFNLDYTKFGFAFGGVLILHYIISYDRVKWLLSTKDNNI
ncbi:YrdB family protein [Gaetbulibacter sp. M240]|uniref:YrdB family protein n=1 Tax=Gaetbulibacter sp. M240 TaxID=3126511 RepID=UPI00374FCA07